MRAALDDDVPLVTPCCGRARNQRGTAFGGYQLQDGVGSIGGLIGKINPRGEPLDQAAHENRYHDVRRLYLAMRPRYAAGLDRGEGEAAFPVGGDAAEAAEACCCGTAVLRVGVDAMSIGLPDFEHAVGNGVAVAVQYLAGYDDGACHFFR